VLDTMNADQRGVFQKAAFSVLSGDQRRASADPKLGEANSGGGQKLAAFETIDVTADGDVVLKTKDGREVSAAMLSDGVFSPNNRGLAPADVHDAVYDAAMRAAAQL
jgi:hypothetical protein